MSAWVTGPDGTRWNTEHFASVTITGTAPNIGLRAMTSHGVTVEVADFATLAEAEAARVALLSGGPVS